ncbi:MAG: ATP-binding protein [Trueperaceae bacterium]
MNCRSPVLAHRDRLRDALAELGPDADRRLWVRGAFPRSYLAGSAAEPARALGVDPSTARRYLDLLTDALVVRQLQPWHANLRKRQVRAPKVYVRDSGLLHALLGLETEKSLLEHPKVGASWEGAVIEQILATTPHDDAHFWATHQGAEVDLVLHRGERRIGVEIKRTDAPKITRSMRIAVADLELDRLSVVYPGQRRYPLAEGIEAVPFRELASPDALVFDDG